jgi:hypothetical protein
VVVVVSVAEPGARVSENIAAKALEKRPKLPCHSCRSGELVTFGDNIVGASLPHLMEHIAIDLLVEAYPGQAFAGNTKRIAMSTTVDTSTEGAAACANEYQYAVRVGIADKNLTAHLAQQILTALINASNIVNELSCYQ